MNSLNLLLKPGDKVVFKESDRVFVCAGASWGHQPVKGGASLDGRFEDNGETARMDAMTIDAERTKEYFAEENGWRIDTFDEAE